MTRENTRILIIPAQDGTGREVPKGYSLTPIITLDFFFYQILLIAIDTSYALKAF